MTGPMKVSFPFRRAWPVNHWPGAAFCLSGLLVLAAGCQRGVSEKPAASAPAAAQIPKTGAENPPATPPASTTEIAPAPKDEPATARTPPREPEPVVEKPAATLPPSRTDSRPAHVVALEKLGAVLDYGVGDRLIDVDLDGKPATDADLDHLAPLTDLKILNLSGSRITDAGLAKLAPLKRLKFLYLFKTDITDAGLAHLKELPRLEVLCLDQTLITDAGVKSLEALPRLEKLHVHSRVPLSDKSIESLSKHVRLFELKVGGPGFTEQGITRLREALPNCKVQYDPNAEATEG
jgi:hypothetical protein